MMKKNCERINLLRPKWSEIVAETENSGGELIPRNGDGNAGLQKWKNIVKEKISEGQHRIIIIWK
jgi:hypothetical protein